MKAITGMKSLEDRPFLAKLCLAHETHTVQEALYVRQSTCRVADAPHLFAYEVYPTR